MSIEVCIPMPLQIVIDDVGWRTGRDGSAVQQPYRTGIAREHVAEDYLAIVELGRRLNMAPQVAMILSQWDTTNALRNIPSASWMGDRWDNSRVVGPWIDECAQIIRDHRDHFEVTLHGIGHEFWNDGIMSRAEWHDNGGNLRPTNTIRAKLDLFFELHERHRLGPPPRSFVPCAFLHHFAGQGDNLATILRPYGITSLSTPFAVMHRSQSPQFPGFGIDDGVLTIDRGDGMFDWNVIDPHPTQPPDWPILGLHWPQLLHPDPSRNGEVIDRWVAVLDAWRSRFGFLLARDTDALCAQLAHQTLTRISIDDDTVFTIDATKTFAETSIGSIDRPLTLHFRVSAERPVSAMNVPISPVQPKVRVRVPSG